MRWYLRFKLSYRDLAELARELGVSIAPSTVLRWVVRYVPEFAKCWQAYPRPVGDSWRADETYLKVGGQWMYLYRAVDEQGKTVESYLSRTRDVTAAKAFFRKALKRHGEPRVITLDGFEPTHAALRRMGMNNEFNYLIVVPLWPMALNAEQYMMSYLGLQQPLHSLGTDVPRPLANFRSLLRMAPSSSRSPRKRA